MSTAEGFEEFVAIVDCGSVSGAAEALGLPRATISRRLARLEERLAVRLLHRTTRRMKMSPQGEVLYPKARRVVLEAKEAESSVRRLDGVPRGLLRISIPVGAPPTLFAEWIGEFQEEYPQVSLEMVASSTYVDLVSEGFDLALRTETGNDSSLIARTLTRNVRVAVATPAYLKKWGTPESAEALDRHNCILGYTTGNCPERHWPLLDGGSVTVSGTIATNQMSLRLEAAKRSLGVTLAFESLAEDALRSGALVPVLPDVVGRKEVVCLVYPEREFLEPKVRAFVDFLPPRIEAARAAYKAKASPR